MAEGCHVQGSFDRSLFHMATRAGSFVTSTTNMDVGNFDAPATLIQQVVLYSYEFLARVWHPWCPDWSTAIWSEQGRMLGSQGSSTREASLWHPSFQTQRLDGKKDYRQRLTRNVSHECGSSIDILCTVLYENCTHCSGRPPTFCNVKICCSESELEADDKALGSGGATRLRALQTKGASRSRTGSIALAEGHCRVPRMVRPVPARG